MTAISSLDTTDELVFEPGDLPRNRAFRMEITVTPYTDAQFSQPATGLERGQRRDQLLADARLLGGLEEYPVDRARELLF